MINILHILPAGPDCFRGIDAYLLNYYRVINKDEIHFDFAFCGKNTMKLYIDDELLNKSRFIEMNVISYDQRNTLSNWKELYRRIRELTETTRYDIIEVHTSSPLTLTVEGMALSRARQKKIAHSHALPVPTDSLPVKMISAVCTRILEKKYDHYFSCSYEAGIVFGKVRDTDKFHVINNAIDCKKYIYNPELREQIRNENNIKTKTTVIGYVARLEEEKNHLFLIDVFDEYRKIVPNSLLWLIGEGPEREKIEKKIAENGIADHTVMFGERKDVPRLLQAMDAFVVPSFREGLCIVAIEAQASGLPTIVTTGIPDACCVTDRIIRISLDEGPQKWAEKINERIEKNKRDEDQRGVIDHGFDLDSAGKKLQDFYTSLMKTL